MIILRKRGLYKLIETKHHTKILFLGRKMYAWVEPAKIGEILVTTHKLHKTDCVLSLGQYLMYDVKDEPYLTDQLHLELEVGMGQWQGYLLLSGLPNAHKIRARIIPTKEVITDSHRHKQGVNLPNGLAAAL